MDLTAIELDFTSNGPGPDTARGALTGLLFLIVVAVLARWAENWHNR